MVSFSSSGLKRRNQVHVLYGLTSVEYMCVICSSACGLGKVRMDTLSCQRMLLSLTRLFSLSRSHPLSFSFILSRCIYLALFFSLPLSLCLPPSPFPPSSPLSLSISLSRLSRVDFAFKTIFYFSIPIYIRTLTVSLTT